MNNYVLWIMGLSGSGKSTISEMILNRFPNKFILLDNDIFRSKYPSSFTREMRIKTCSDMLYKAKELSEINNVIVNKITPYESIRQFNREVLGNKYIEVLCKCPLEILIKRDVKGLYKKAMSNEIEHMIGVSSDNDDIFEDSVNSDLVIDTSKSIEETEQAIVNFINNRL